MKTKVEKSKVKKPAKKGDSYSIKNSMFGCTTWDKDSVAPLLQIAEALKQNAIAAQQLCEIFKTAHVTMNAPLLQL